MEPGAASEWGVPVASAPPAPVIPVLTAPTACGKTALALELAELSGGRSETEIVSADAFLVYRGLDIGTAKPTLQERARVPHHLIDVAEVQERYDVARYALGAQAAIADILERGRLPLVVGGTGFYLSALLGGLPLTPPSQPPLRAALEAELQSRGLDALLHEIERSSPAESQRMERNPRRVLRALEVFRTSGRWPADFGHSAPAYRYRVVAYTLPDAELVRRIPLRVADMFEQGWPAEAEWLAGRVDPAAQPRPTVWQALGYAQALACARGTLPEREARAQIEGATRQYVRRQLTWLRGQLKVPLLTLPEARRALAAALSLHD